MPRKVTKSEGEEKYVKVAMCNEEKIDSNGDGAGEVSEVSIT